MIVILLGIAIIQGIMFWRICQHARALNEYDLELGLLQGKTSQIEQSGSWNPKSDGRMVWTPNHEESVR